MPHVSKLDLIKLLFFLHLPIKKRFQIQSEDAIVSHLHISMVPEVADNSSQIYDTLMDEDLLHMWKHCYAL